MSFQDLKKWVWFSGLKFWGDLEKFQGKSEKKFKILKLSKIVPKCPNVFWGDFFENLFAQCSMESPKVFAKKSKKIQNCKKAQICSQNCPNLFWTCFVAFFSKVKLPRVPWRVGFWKISKKNQKIFKIPKVPKVVFKSVQTCFEHALRRFFRVFLPSVPCRAFQIFWT